jgi:hypothetical protein
MTDWPCLLTEANRLGWTILFVLVVAIFTGTIR